MHDHPFHRSKRFIAYALTVLLLGALVLLRAPVTVLDRLAEACTIGLPILLGGESWIRARAVGLGVAAPQPPGPLP